MANTSLSAHNSYMNYEMAVRTVK